MTRVIRKFLIPLLLAMPAAAMAAERPPRNIVSLNLCADQLLIALADRNQIAALTQFSHDPQMSFEAGKARLYPISKGSAEEVLALRPDLVITTPYQRSDTLALLQDRGMKRVDIKDAESITDIYANIRIVARAIGHADRGEKLIRRMGRDLDRLSTDRPGRGRVAAYYQRRGYLTGTGTLLDEMLTRLGLTNLAVKLGRPALSRVSLEEMIAAKPDFLLLESETRQVMDHGTEMLHHPALRRSVAPSRQLYLPQALTVCGGPSYLAAIAALDRMIRQADAAHGR